MFLVNGIKAKLIQFNRNGSSLAYDDEDRQEIDIRVIPYNVGDDVNFGTYTEPSDSGYFMLHRNTDVKEGDQIVYRGKTYTISKLDDKWIYNRVEYIKAYVK